MFVWLTVNCMCFLLICILPKCFYISLLTLLYIFSFLLCNGDIEPNPGLRKLKQNSLSICHWNLNRLSAHKFAKLAQLKVYNSIYKHDFICLSETYLDSASPKNLLEIEDYNLVRADHLSNVKRGGVCIYYLLPPYQRLIWDYKKAHTSNIRTALDLIKWEKLFNHKNFNAQVNLFNETVFNIFRNYVPNKYITCDDKDPAWMNENIKSKTKSKTYFINNTHRMVEKKVIL